MKHFDMFSGYGGFTIPCKEQGIETIGFSEIDKYAIAVYKYHFPEVRNYGDATKIKPDELPDFDLLTGGFPCQSFSIAGKRKGLEDTRGTLFYEIARIVSVKRPSLLLLENVRGLLSHDTGRTFGLILSTFSDMGYILEWQVLNSKDFGVPQNRERVFIIGYIRGECKPEVFPIGESIQKNTKTDKRKINQSILQHSRKGKETKYNRKEIAGTIKQPSGNTANLIIHNMQPRCGNPKLGGTGHLSRQDGLTYTVDPGNSNAVEKDMRIRRLTPLECERLMGLPDRWTEWGRIVNPRLHGIHISDTQRYKLCGNGVVINVVREIIRRLF